MLCERHKWLTSVGHSISLRTLQKRLGTNAATCGVPSAPAGVNTDWGLGTQEDQVYSILFSLSNVANKCTCFVTNPSEEFSGPSNWLRPQSFNDFCTSIGAYLHRAHYRMGPKVLSNPAIWSVVTNHIKMHKILTAMRLTCITMWSNHTGD